MNMKVIEQLEAPPEGGKMRPKETLKDAVEWVHKAFFTVIFYGEDRPRPENIAEIPAKVRKDNKDYLLSKEKIALCPERDEARIMMVNHVVTPEEKKQGFFAFTSGRSFKTTTPAFTRCAVFIQVEKFANFFYAVIMSEKIADKEKLKAMSLYSELHGLGHEPYLDRFIEMELT